MRRESPDFSPDGRQIVFSALQNAVGDIYLLDIETREVTNLTGDEFADYAPTFSPDGSHLIYVARISGNNKLFELDLATRRKRQLTFGTSSEAGAQFLDENTVVFASTATDPLAPIDPEVAANADIYNVWTLDLNNGELRQYTDTATGNVSTVVLPDDPIRASPSSPISRASTASTPLSGTSRCIPRRPPISALPVPTSTFRRR